MKAYEMRSDSLLEPAAKRGTIVYPFNGYDYGLAADDTAFTGVPHSSVTLQKSGAGPAFTHPTVDLIEVIVSDFPKIDASHVRSVCRPGTEECCRYLTVRAGGWGCEKLTSFRETLDSKVKRGEMRATGDNCEGRR